MASHPEKTKENAAPSGGKSIYVAIAAAIGGIGVFAGIFAWFFSGIPIDYDRELSGGLQKLKREISSEVRRLPLSIDLQDLEQNALKSKWELIAGAIALEDSEKTEVRERAIMLAEEASKHLLESQKLGFPRGYEGLGNFLLGKVLYQLFKWPEAIEPLEIAVTEWPPGRAESLARLVDIDLATEDLPRQAVEDRLDYWDGFVGLSPEDRNRGKLKRIDCAIAFEDFDKAIELAKNFPETSAYVPDVKCHEALARFLKLNSDQDETPAPERIEELEEVLRKMKAIAQDPRLTGISQRRNHYYTGLVLQKLGRWNESVSVLNVLRQSSPHTIEGLSGAISEMNALVKLQRYDEAVATMRQVSDQFGKLEWYNNDWQPIPLLRSQVNAIGQEMLVDRAYPQVIEFANKVPPFCDKQDRLHLLSVAYGRWANSLRGKTAAVDNENLDIRTSLRDIEVVDDSVSQPEETSKGKRFWQKLFNESAKNFEELALLQMRSPEYFDLIWQAINNYQSSGDLKRCNAIINSTLPYEAIEERPRAYLMLAENFFAIDKPDRSLIELRKCIAEHSEHPLAFQSRLNAARILAERSDFDEAQKYLEENLFESSLSPQSPVWKESLFEFGRNYYRQGEMEFSSAELLKQESGPTAGEERLVKLENANSFFTKSVDRLGEWLKRYPDDSRRFETMYSIGKAYQLAAQYPEVLLARSQPASAEIQKQRVLQYRDLVQNARSTFEQIRVGMNDNEESAVRTPSLRSLLRNSYFAEADLTFQLQDYENALTLYRNVANRFLAEPESLEALTQAAECLKKLGRAEEGLRVISQAREILSQIPPEQDEKFVAVTRFSRNQWNELLSRMESTVY